MNLKHYNRLQLNNSALPDVDLHHEITRSAVDTKSYENHQKQRSHRRQCEEDELVRYMSNLPGYLERVESIHDKVLNVGVLDWAYLEQWKCSHTHLPHISSRSSTSASNKSVSVSMDRSPSYSSRGRSLSPSCRRICDPPLLSHFMASAMRDHSQDAKFLEKYLEDCQNISRSKNNTKGQFVMANDHFPQNLPDNELKARNLKDLDPKMDMKRGDLSSDQMDEVAASYIELPMRTQGGKFERKVEAFQQPNMGIFEKDILNKNKPPLCMSRDIYLHDHSGIHDLPTPQCWKSQIPSQTSFIEIHKELSLEDANYKNLDSCTLQDEVYCSHSQAKGYTSIGTERIKVHTTSSSTPLSAKMGMRPFKSGQAERKQPITTMLSARDSSQVLAEKVASEKSRSSSPFRRFSFSSGFVSKGSGHKEDTLRRHGSSIRTTMSSSENMRGWSTSDTLGNGKAGEAGRSRSSPLRRLLSPLLKPKTVNCHHSAESSQKNALLTNKNCMSANGKSSSLRSAKGLMKDYGVDHSTIDKDNSLKDKKHVSSTLQALLRIAWKNGLPTFTFAVDKSSSILAATMQKLTPIEKDGCSCIYTFFTFDVNEKAANWMKQAGKGKGPNYIRHIVAQMKVSNPHYLDFTGRNCVGSSALKEFVLYSTKLNQGCDQAPNYQLDDELAAIILKIPKTIGFIDNVRCSSSLDDRRELVHATVVLPSGVHSHPSKGGPSSLIERWKSGGSCDCGGWDMGCKLKIFANEIPASKNSSPSPACYEDHFELFLQWNGQEHRPAFRFVPFKQGIFSVVYDSSFTLLQAFSICIALLDCKISCELSGSTSSVEENTQTV